MYVNNPEDLDTFLQVQHLGRSLNLALSHQKEQRQKSRRAFPLSGEIKLSEFDDVTGSLHYKEYISL